MGWISPIVIVAKVLIQKIWKVRLDWDDPLSDAFPVKWLKFRMDLIDIPRIEIPRCICCSRRCHVELHAFSDASRAAYAAAAFIRVVNNDDSIHVRLLSYKTKVTPIEK